MALVQRSWCHPAQAELFGTVILTCPVRVQLFVEAFVRNIGPGNPLQKMGVDRLRLESFVRHVYVDIPENYSQARFYASLVTILPLLNNLRSIYLVMRRWENRIWEVELGRLMPEHAPPSLERLCIQVSKDCGVKMISYSRSYSRFWRGIQMLYYLHVSQIPTFGGGIGLARGDTSRPWPSSVKTFGGIDHLTCPSPKHLRQQRRSYANGWLIRHWSASSFGLVLIVSNCPRDFKSSMGDSITFTVRSPLAIDIPSDLTETQEHGSYYHQLCECAQLSLNSESMSVLMDVGFALPWRTTRTWRA